MSQFRHALRAARPSTLSSISPVMATPSFSVCTSPATCVWCPRPTPAAPWQGHVRLLSSTAPRSAGIISFEPTSSTELDTLLRTLRDKIILPTYLTADGRTRISSKHHKDSLRVSPIVIEVDGEEHRFAHMDPMELPNVRSAVRKAVALMDTPSDFQNLPRLLEGLERANRRLRDDDYARVIRRAGERGCIYTIIECARTVRRTGFRLDSSEKVSEILTQIQLKAVNSAWDEAETRQALKWAELVVDLLSEPLHGRRAHVDGPGIVGASLEGSTAAMATTPAPAPPTIPLARDPQLLAARLHLAAAVAEKFDGGVDVDGKVARYAAELVQLWPANGKGLKAVHPADAYSNKRGELYYLTQDNKYLGVASPLLHGLDATIRVLGASDDTDTTLVGELQARRDALYAEVQAALAAMPDRRGAQTYEKFFGPK